MVFFGFFLVCNIFKTLEAHRSRVQQTSKRKEKSGFVCGHWSGRGGGIAYSCSWISSSAAATEMNTLPDMHHIDTCLK